MKKAVLFILIGIGVQCGLHAQKKLPNVSLQDLDGNTILASDLTNEGKPIILSFWATWCKPCLTELAAFNDEYEDWVEETGVKIIAISIDDARTSARVKSLVYGNDWPFEVYIDTNQDLKRSLNVLNVPHTIVLNGKNEIVWQHTTYNPGSEKEVIDQVRQLLK